MAIKYLRGIYGVGQTNTTRPQNFIFPTGLNRTTLLDTANSSTTTTTSTVDIFLVAGGGSIQWAGNGGGGGGGGFRLLTANTLSSIDEIANTQFSDSVNQRTFIPVVVGGADTNSCLGKSYIACRGGQGSMVFGSGVPGGSGGGGGRGGGTSPEGNAPFNINSGGSGIFGQGCNGGASSGPGTSGTGGSACANASTSGFDNSFTGAPVVYSAGGRGSFPSGSNSAAPTPPVNSGGGGGNSSETGPGSGPQLSGASGRVAVRYRNPAAPTTPLATGGNCICCTGGCIIHIFNSSGCFNVNTTAIVN